MAVTNLKAIAYTPYASVIQGEGTLENSDQLVVDYVTYPVGTMYIDENGNVFIKSKITLDGSDNPAPVAADFKQINNS